MNQSAGERMGGNFFAGIDCDSVFRGFRGNGFAVRHHQCHDKFSPVANHHRVQNVRTALKRIFDGLRRDKFPRGGFQQILHAIGNEQIIVFVHVADVAGMKPAVFVNHFARGFRPFVVPLHDHRATHQNFPVVRGFHFAIRNRQSGTAHAIAWKIAGNDGRSFRQSVTLVNRDADAPEKFRQRFRKRSAAGRNNPQPSAGAFANFCVHQFVGQRPLHFQ